MQEITEEVLAAKATGKRVTLADVEASIKSEHYFSAAEGVAGARYGEDTLGESPIPKELEVMTFCVLVLQNGFTVTGQSACADPANYDKVIGDGLARKDAVSKIWAFLGFQLRTEIMNG